ncbi:MAG: fibronectin type III domain-containing protein [Candidatus Peribacteraceae bacterium]|nr:fibronectin type III domain-containing protein [Candidatus Peribacteraceae bacterium]
MLFFSALFRQTSLPHILAIAMITMVLQPTAAYAQEVSAPTAGSTGTTFTVRPHCEQAPASQAGIFGEVPHPDPIVQIGSGVCYSYPVENPQSLKTSVMKVGDTLDIDLVANNPEGNKIQRARAWISYDPTILEGVSIEIDSAFPQITPGEKDFDTAKGYVMIDVQSTSGQEPSANPVPIARIIFRVLKAPPVGTILSFYDIQPSGHTFLKKVNASSPDGESAMGADPTSLHVIFGSHTGEVCTQNTDCFSGSCVNGACAAGVTPPGDGDGATMCTTDAQCPSGRCVNGTCATGAPSEGGNLPDGSTCQTSNECASGNCDQGACHAKTKPNGSPCQYGGECSSGICMNGICQASATEPTPPPSDGTTEPIAGEQTGGSAFSLLQVRNLRLTTKDTSVFLAWDALQSSVLQAYNIYYGTTSGRYIQRKTVAKEIHSLAIHDLPAKTTYYFAIRAVSTANEESAFSQEVAVSIGEPTTSTAPLSLNGQVLRELKTNPLGTGNGNGGAVPGETGMSTTIILLLLCSAVIGTTFASRRQLTVTVAPPSHE